MTAEDIKMIVAEMMDPDAQARDKERARRENPDMTEAQIEAGWKAAAYVFGLE